MPPITSPRRTVLHSPPAPLRPVPVPIPGAPVPPLSSSASTFASTPPSAGTSPGTSLGSVMARTLSHGASSYGHSHGHSHSNSSHTGSLGHAPYMVALAGWPEPLFVAERELWDVRKRSRPTTPTGFRGEPRPKSTYQSTATACRSATAAHARARPQASQQAVRATRPPGPESAPSSSASTPPRHDAPGPNPLSGTLARLALGDHRERVPNPTLAARTVRRHIDKLGGFSDPRYHANAAVVGRGRSLRVAPAWASSTPVQPYADRPPSGHGRGWPAVSRAVPEVWPPPGVIAQVYPRDPDTIFYPRAGSSGEEDEPACKAARTVVTEAERKREREASASAPEDKDKEEVKVERGMDVDR